MTDTDWFDVASLCEAFQNTVARCGEMLALRTPGGAQEISWREYGDRVRRIATGLAALGVGPGDTVGIMLLNRPEFALVDTAALHLGAVPFSVYNTSSPEQISYLFASADNKIVITEQLFLPAIAVAGMGVELTHASMLAELRGCQAVIPARQGDRNASYLPAAHVADRWVRPTVWGAVPRVWEKIKAGLEANGITDPSALPEEARKGVRQLIGLDDKRWAVCGAAPVAPEVLQFFSDLGVPICELWGMSELSCCATINPPEDIRIGTVGKALPGVELSVAEDGELLVRGPLLMRGYRGQPDKTAETIDADGWLHTGDIVTMDDGYITIVDRKKELIINAALLVLDPDVCAAYVEETVLPDGSTAALAGDAGVQQQIAAAIEAANARLSRVEQIRKYRVLETDWLPGGDELTPTMKLKRRPIGEKYASVIEELYAGV